MNYEEFNKGCFEEAKRLYKTANADQRYVLECLFPELKKIEDERIRKNIISWLKNIEGQTISINDYNSAIAWLEKQGEETSWKPSEEQMNALETAVSSLQSTALESLYRDLERL